jgi:hypothetical protein
MSEKLDGSAIVDLSVAESKLAAALSSKINNAYAVANLAYDRANNSLSSVGGNITGNLVFTSGGRLGLNVTPNTLLHVQGTTTLQEVIEKINLSSTGLTANLNYDVLNQPILYLRNNATANGTINFRGNSTVAIDTLLRTGQSMTVSLLVTNGSNPYKANVVLVDGIFQAAKWAGGTEPIGGNSFSVDLYTYTIVKTANATFTVFASQQKYG